MTRYYDVFNGDADGICALLQWRLANPQSSTLITGVKRDISLLKQVDAKDSDNITVLDISMAKNTEALEQVLEQGATVFYCDHHDPGTIPEHANLDVLINTEANVCTSLLVNGRLNNAFPLWAVVGAFGDNLKQSAQALAKTLDVSEAELQQLENLGIYINYNGYGASLDDLHFTPVELYQKLSNFSSPLKFMAEDKAVFEKLEQGYLNDMASAHSVKSMHENTVAAVFALPNEKWARRVSGVYSNDLANDNPDRAHAVLTDNGNDGFLVSVRAPLNNKQGAVDICKQFATGGGRAAAAGINHLPKEEVDAFVNVLNDFYR